MHVYLLGYCSAWNLNVVCETGDRCYIYCIGNDCESCQQIDDICESKGMCLRILINKSNDI